MTFEIEFEHCNVIFKADVTRSGNDFLVNLVSPAHYESTPTIAFTIHEDGSMKYDNSLFNDRSFMPAIESAIIKYIRLHNIAFFE